MKPVTKSPFEYHRWEDERDKIIWLPPDFHEWEGTKCIYLTGSRGTGKTTILQGFEWNQRLYNHSLKMQNGSTNPFQKKYIGIYLKIQDFISSQFDQWRVDKVKRTKIELEERRAQIFSLNIELALLEKIILALQGLRSRNILKFSPKEEKEIVNKILLERPEIKFFLESGKTDYNLSEIRISFKRMYERIGFCAKNGIPLSPIECFSTLQFGSFLEEVSQLLLLLCNKKMRVVGSEKDWRIKICVDDLQVFKLYQQKTINSIVKNKKTLSYIVASVDGSTDISSTFLNDPLTHHDREHVSLDEMYYDNKSRKFENFVTNVSKLRIQVFLKDDKIDFNLRKILGTYDLNYLIEPALKRSENPDVKKFIQETVVFSKIWDKFQINTTFAKNLDDDDKFVIYPESIEEKYRTLPYLEYYLIQKLNLGTPIEEVLKAKDTDIRSLKSQTFRKKRVAAMLCLCNEFKLPIPYSGFFLVKAMSNGGIRDFFIQMHEIYKKEHTSLDRFIKKVITREKQDEGIREASKKRYRGISYELHHRFTEVENLVSTLGMIEHAIQSNYKNINSLKAIERGIFSINLKGLNKTDYENIFEVIKNARQTFSIKILEVEKEKPDVFTNVKFKLHNLFAPKYNFSYRGSVSKKPIHIDGLELKSIFEKMSTREREKLIESIVTKNVEPEKKKKSEIRIEQDSIQSVLTTWRI